VKQSSTSVKFFDFFEVFSDFSHFLNVPRIHHRTVPLAAAPEALSSRFQILNLLKYKEPPAARPFLALLSPNSSDPANKFGFQRTCSVSFYF
jgi:hypothetical protein